MVRYGKKDVVQVDPSSGAILRTVASGLSCPFGLAPDPISGDLFVTEPSCDSNVLRIVNVASPAPFVVPYSTGFAGPDGITATPDGTLYVIEAGPGRVTQVSGTASGSPGQKTTLGAWLDPMADKLLLVTMFVMLTLPDIASVNRLPLWFTVLVISRDVAIVGTVAVVNLAIGPRTFRPSIYGKVATALYIVTGVAALYFNYIGQPSGLVQALIYGSLAITFISAGHYAWQVARTGH